MSRSIEMCNKKIEMTERKSNRTIFDHEVESKPVRTHYFLQREFFLRGPLVRSPRS